MESFELPVDNPQITIQEQRLKIYLKVLFWIYGLALLLYLLPALTFIPGFLKPFPFFNDAAFANNSAIKMALFTGLCFFAAGNIRRNLVIVEVMIGVMALSMIGGLLLFLFVKNDYLIVFTNGSTLRIKWLILASLLSDGFINLLLFIFYTRAQRSRYQLCYFSPSQFRCLAALAEILMHDDLHLLSPKKVAYNVDKYMGAFKGSTKWVTKLCVTGIEIYPLFFLKLPSSYMPPADRKAFLMKHFYQDVTLRLVPPFIRMLVQAMIRMGKQLVFMGYYNDKKIFPSVGYAPFSERPDKEKRLADFPVPGPSKPLAVKTERDFDKDVYHAPDVVIIGSGPGASILARTLLEKGRTVTMIERGDYVDPSQFTEDEIDMFSSLYADGALQLASDFRFQVIQGSCVGGSSVVNNAVCFDTPDPVLDKWADKRGLNTGIDPLQYKLANDEVNRIIGVHSVGSWPDKDVLTYPEYLNPSGVLFLEGAQKLGYGNSPNVLKSVNANIMGCLGCGYCNIGCAYGKKLSMLDTILPQLQEKYGRDRLEIIAGCEVWNLKSKGNVIRSLIGKFKNGRKIEITGKTFVVSAGAISSSLLLQRSSIAVGRAGKRLCFNLGSPMTAVFPHVINSYDGLQISHFLEVEPSRGFVYETWFNPPMFQATVMPGWWDDHYKNMHRYNRMACAGVLVGTESNAEVTTGGLTGRNVLYTPTQSDFNMLLDGLKLAGNIYLQAGADCVMPNTFTYQEYFNSQQLDNMVNVIKDNSDINLGTGHPQGGNVISKDPNVGVVDENLQVYGYDNLFVCDASVIPSSLGVNPQVTVMTLAHYAAPFIATK